MRNEHVTYSDMRSLSTIKKFLSRNFDPKDMKTVSEDTGLDIINYNYFMALFNDRDNDFVYAVDDTSKDSKYDIVAVMYKSSEGDQLEAINVDTLTRLLGLKDKELRNSMSKKSFINLASKNSLFKYILDRLQVIKFLSHEPFIVSKSQKVNSTLKMEAFFELARQKKSVFSYILGFSTPEPNDVISVTYKDDTMYADVCEIVKNLDVLIDEYDYDYRMSEDLLKPVDITRYKVLSEELNSNECLSLSKPDGSYENFVITKESVDSVITNIRRE